MYLFHGTPASFDEPSLSKCKPHRDFGCGFYLALDYFDALTMAIKNTKYGYIQTYQLVDVEGLNVLEFDDRSKEWLRFIVASRLGVASNFDLVIGKMAGGGRNLKSKFSKFRMLGTPVETVVKNMESDLTNTELGVQYAFLTERALAKLIRVSTEIVETEACYDQKRIH